MKEIIFITGIDGFIGSSLARKILEKLDVDIIGVLKFSNCREKFFNYSNLPLFDLLHKDQIFNTIKDIDPNRIKAVIHLGACSATTQWDGEYLINNNHIYTKDLCRLCVEKKIPFYYASSASVYGLKGSKQRSSENLAPLNMYALSKLLTDRFVKNFLKKNNSSKIYGLRFFNVFGDKESHKKNMASPVWKFNSQAKNDSQIKIFKRHNQNQEIIEDKYVRDFIWIEDAANLIIKFIENKYPSDIYDVGTGIPVSFVKIALIVKDWWRNNDREIKLKAIEFPDNLVGSYQEYTKADMSYIEKLGIDWEPHEINFAVSKTLNKINK